MLTEIKNIYKKLILFASFLFLFDNFKYENSYS